MKEEVAANGKRRIKFYDAILPSFVFVRSPPRCSTLFANDDRDTASNDA